MIKVVTSFIRPIASNPYIFRYRGLANTTFRNYDLNGSYSTRLSPSSNFLFLTEEYCNPPDGIVQTVEYYNGTISLPFEVIEDETGNLVSVLTTNEKYRRIWSNITSLTVFDMMNPTGAAIVHYGSFIDSSHFEDIRYFN
jgi:hypothetical protein